MLPIASVSSYTTSPASLQTPSHMRWLGAAAAGHLGRDLRQWLGLTGTRSPLRLRPAGQRTSVQVKLEESTELTRIITPWSVDSLDPGMGAPPAAAVISRVKAGDSRCKNLNDSGPTWPRPGPRTGGGGRPTPPRSRRRRRRPVAATDLLPGTSTKNWRPQDLRSSLEIQKIRHSCILVLHGPSHGYSELERRVGPRPGPPRRP